jgi:hypothetical protein
MAPLELSAHMTVRPGCLDGFKKQAAELIRITQEKDTHTLRYDWFLSLNGTECDPRGSRGHAARVSRLAPAAGGPRRPLR